MIANSLNSTRLHILEIITQYAPRDWKTNPSSVRGRYSLRCPLLGHEADAEHQDHSGSFYVDESEQLFHCFGCGGQGNAYQLRQILSGGDPLYQPPRPAPQPRPQAQPSRRREYTPLQGVSIAQLAQAKGLNPDYLRDTLGWKDTSYRGTPAVEIPYFDENGGDPQLRYRVGLDHGDRFRWKAGAKPRPYGLWELPRLEDFNSVIFIEGETDYATGDFQAFPFQGIPGATNWRPEWAGYYKNISHIYAWQEPGKGGETFIQKLAESFPNLLVIEAPPGIKDVVELADQAGAGFPEFMEELLVKARPVEPGEEPARKPTSPDELDFEEIQAMLGADLPEVRFQQASSRQPFTYENNQNVADVVEDRFNSPYHLGDIPDRSALWQYSYDLFPNPVGARPWGRSGILHRKNGDGVLASFLYSETWRNPANAAYKRRRLYFNLTKRLTGQDLYQRLAPIDDWDTTFRKSLGTRLRRAGAEHIWFDNALSRGFIRYLCNKPLEGFEPVDDLETVLVEALNAIRPPDKPDTPGQKIKPFKPYGGSGAWADGLLETGEKDQDRWELIAISPPVTSAGEADLVGLEIQLVAEGVHYEWVRRYWRGQAGPGLLVHGLTAEDALRMFIPWGFTPTRNGLKYLQEAIHGS